MSSDLVLPGFGTGLIPRDYSLFPSGCNAAAPTFPTELLIPESEWQSRLDAQKAAQSSLLHLREANYETLKSLNQGSHPLCWSFSTTKAVMYLRAIMNQPGLRLSAWWVAGKVKGWRDQGGWNGESLAKIVSEGVPTEALCPGYRSSYDTTETRADAATRKVTEWWDGTESREMNKKIMISALLLGLPQMWDLNHISHSMAGCYLESINPLVVFADNSWDATDQYGPKGLYRLEGSKAIPDAIAMPRVTAAS